MIENIDHVSDDNAESEECGQTGLSDKEVESLLLDKLALFTMNMQAKHHVPSSVVQAVLSELSELIAENTEAVHSKISSLLKSSAVYQNAVAGIYLVLRH